EVERPPTKNVSRVNYCENELYAADKRKQQVQPDIPEKRPKVQPELKWDNRLRPRAENEPLLVDVGDPLQPMELEEARTGLGKTTVTSHRIDTCEAKPIKQRAYRAAPNEHEFIEKELKEMEERGIQPDESKVEKVRNYPIPARPLHHLLQKGVSFDWGQEQQKSFEALKSYLTTAPVLKYPDFNDMFYLYTDASGTGLGA
ncbi:29680_t:CDS:2, partial [Racocetra persica]